MAASVVGRADMQADAWTEVAALADALADALEEAEEGDTEGRTVPKWGAQHEGRMDKGLQEVEAYHTQEVHRHQQIVLLIAPPRTAPVAAHARSAHSTPVAVVEALPVVVGERCAQVHRSVWLAVEQQLQPAVRSALDALRQVVHEVGSALPPASAPAQVERAHLESSACQHQLQQLWMSPTSVQFAADLEARNRILT